jgi:hypothetical protein
VSDDLLHTWLRCLLLGCLLAASPLVSSQGNDDDWLFEVAVPVPSDSTADRRQAESEALLEALSRLTGLKEVPNSPTVQSALGQPNRYYFSFSYETRPDPQGDPMRLVRFRFSEDALRQLAVRAGLPVWSSRRPLLVAWIVVEEGGERTMLSADSDHAARRALAERAEHRGLPVTFPLMDLEEQMRVSPVAVWGGFTDDVVRASERYGAEAVAVGRISQSATGRWLGRWDVTLPRVVADRFGSLLRLEFDGDTTEAVVEPLVEQLTDLLAQRYAVLSGGAIATHWFRVRGVIDVQTYARLIRYLDGLDPVRDVDVMQVQGDQLTVRVRGAGSMETLMQIFELDRRLVLSPRRRYGDTVLDFTWRG